MKNKSLLIALFIITACGNIDNKISNATSQELNFSYYNSILTYDCMKSNIDTVTVDEILDNDSIYFWGNYIIPATNQTLLLAKISYLNEDLIKKRLPSYYGRNSEHLTFYLFSDSAILFSNNFIQYDTLTLKDVSKLILEYYFEEIKHLKFEVNKNNKGIDVRVFKNVNPKRLQDFINILTNSYIEVVDKYCDKMFQKEFKMLSTSETIKLMEEIKFSSEIIISSVDSPYFY